MMMDTNDSKHVPETNKAARVQQRISNARDSLPGERNGLPPGKLRPLPPDPQGDENRDPPRNAPTIPP